jgi:hypothetical protein
MKSAFCSSSMFGGDPPPNDRCRREHHPGVHLPAPQEVLADLDLKQGRWHVQICQTHERTRTVDGEQVTYTDNTVKARRLR